MGAGAFIKVVLKNFDILAGPVVSLVYPLYASIQAIESKSPLDDQQWLTYWVLYSFITLFELTFDKLIEWLPFWSYVKLILTCWLVIPYFSGAAYVYEHFVRPVFVNPRNRTVNIWYVPKMKDIFSKKDDILTAAEKYIQENGPDAFHHIISKDCFSLLLESCSFDLVIQRIGELLTRSIMDSDIPDTTYDEEDVSTDERVDESCERAKKNKRGRVPKRLLKAERERLKREQLNDLFNNLASALAICEPNNGKACILGEAIRLVNDLTSQIKCLREENATLLSESNYVSVERDELKDENNGLESQIQKIQQEIMERKGQLKPDLNVAPPESWQQAEMDAADVVQQPRILGPLYVIPFGQSLEADLTTSKVASHVKKPHPRYPSPGDSWPSQLLQKQP